MEYTSQFPTNDLPTAEPGLPLRRATCSACSRPNPVCICPHLPSQPIDTKTHVLIVLHPHEARHKFSTTPLVTRCLSNSSAVVSRKLRHGLSPFLDCSPPRSAVYLFPPHSNSESESNSLSDGPYPTSEPKSIPLSELAKLQPRPSLLVVFDATWQHAGEMVRASEGYLRECGARRAFLEFDRGVGGGSIYDSELVLRKEPFAGCVSTMEAVARGLRVLEPDGAVVEERLIGVLREIVRLQARFLKPAKPRPKLEKKKVIKARIEKEKESTSGG